MPPWTGRFTIHGGAQEVALQEGEEVVLSARAQMLAGNVGGTLLLTNRRLLFEPHFADPVQLRRHRVDLPLAEITVLKLTKPLLGGTPLLNVGSTSHAPNYWIANAAEWIATIENLRGGGGLPAPPPPTVPLTPALPDLPAEGATPADALPPEDTPLCPICMTPTVRQPDGSLRCVRCSPPE